MSDTKNRPAREQLIRSLDFRVPDGDWLVEDLEAWLTEFLEERESTKQVPEAGKAE